MIAATENTLILKQKNWYQ